MRKTAAILLVCVLSVTTLLTGCAEMAPVLNSVIEEVKNSEDLTATASEKTEADSAVSAETESASAASAGTESVSAASADNADEKTADEESSFTQVKTKVKTNEGNRKIIIDTDTAGDDAAAMLIAAEASDLDILGITVAAGNVTIEQAIDNALMTMEIANRKDIPVYAGATSPLSGKAKETFSIFGEDGMGDAGLIHPSGEAEQETAVDFMLSMAEAYPGEVEIITLAPATNIALAIQKNPDIMKKIKRIWTMGTAGFGKGNATPVAEFNTYIDAEAYDIMLDAGIPVTVIGLDMLTEDTNLNAEMLKKMSEAGEANRFIAKACDKLADSKEETYGERFADMADPVAMACAVWPGFVLNTDRVSAHCITDDSHAYGQVLFYRENGFYDSMPKNLDYDVDVVTSIAHANFVEKMFLTLENCAKREENFSVENLNCMVDLHLHLAGALSADNARQLAKLNNISVPDNDEELLKLLRAEDTIRDYEELHNDVSFAMSLLQTPEAMKLAVSNLLKEEKEQGVMYCEIRFVPQLYGDNQREIVAAACEAINEAEIPCGLVLSGLRSDADHDENLITVLTAQEHLGKGVVGIDLEGDEARYYTEDYRDMFSIAKLQGIPYTIHAGEAAGCESIMLAEFVEPQRIGHGVRAIENNLVVDYLSTAGTVLELCPTSNISSGIVPTYMQYPLRLFMNKDVKVTINTDYPVTFNTDIKSEFRHMIETFDLSKEEVKQLLVNAVEASFANAEVKQELLEKIDREFNN